MLDWMYWVTAIVFTGVGFYISAEVNKKAIINITIETLIREGYIKTRGFGKDKELIKYDDY
jgi:hypothetical protein